MWWNWFGFDDKNNGNNEPDVSENSKNKLYHQLPKKLIEFSDRLFQRFIGHSQDPVVFRLECIGGQSFVTLNCLQEFRHSTSKLQERKLADISNSFFVHFAESLFQFKPKLWHKGYSNKCLRLPKNPHCSSFFCSFDTKWLQFQVELNILWIITAAKMFW